MSIVMDPIPPALDASDIEVHRLWHDAPAPYVANYRVMGVPLTFASNTPKLLSIAAEIFGPPMPQPVSANFGVRFHCFLHEASEQTAEAAPPLCRVQDNYYLMCSGGSVGFADRTARFGAAFITPCLLQNRMVVQQRFIETLILFLLTRYRPATLHAAGLTYNGRGVLLTGASGAGKSTMAYAGLKSGFNLLAEDEVFGTLPGRFAEVFGNPRFVHLRTDATALFPELVNTPVVERVDDDPRLRVCNPKFQEGKAITCMRVEGVVLLARGETNRLLPVDPTRLRQALMQYDHSRPLDTQAQEIMVRRLLEGRSVLLEVAEGRVMEAVQIVKEWLMTS